MNELFLKRYVSNLFHGIQKNIVNMLEKENDVVLLKHQTEYVKGLREIIGLLTFTLTKIEDIYYKYFLYPRLQQIKNKVQCT